MEVSESITRKSASNLALAFILLPREKRRAMAALYAFCREVDDIADEDTVPPSQRHAALQQWRDDIAAIYQGGSAALPVNRELQPVIQHFKLPFPLFDDLIKGVEMDLDITRYETFAQLETYCYHVASVVGLLSIEVFGYTNPGCRDYAIFLGKALQLTNILRDVRNDAERGRLYLPLEECRRFAVSPDDILKGRYTENYFRLAEHMAARAREFYAMARQALPPEDRRSMATAELMGSVYWRLLMKLEGARFNVFDRSETTRLTKPQKILLIARMWLRQWSGTAMPNYG
jgi:phytoene synthase